MTQPDRSRPDPFAPTRRGWLERRRDKIAEEIARNRRGEYTVPTWVLATALVAFVAGWVALIILA
ncbi:MAG: hypothetical protein ACRDT2_23025 [Natronosporangium sp.]